MCQEDLRQILPWGQLSNLRITQEIDGCSSTGRMWDHLHILTNEGGKSMSIKNLLCHYNKFGAFLSTSN